MHLHSNLLRLPLVPCARLLPWSESSSWCSGTQREHTSFATIPLLQSCAMSNTNQNNLHKIYVGQRSACSRFDSDAASKTALGHAPKTYAVPLNMPTCGLHSRCVPDARQQVTPVPLGGLASRSPSIFKWACVARRLLKQQGCPQRKTLSCLHLLHRSVARPSTVLLAITSNFRIFRHNALFGRDVLPALT